jgi:putative SOS response-associated peptidase YedK
MCTNYKAGRQDNIEHYFRTHPPSEPWREDIWPDYEAPIIRRDIAGARTASLANFGMVPKSTLAPGVRPFDTVNARIETIGEKRSFKAAWMAGQTCIIPAEVIYEPNWETGKSVRWSIGLASGEPLAIAGIWRAWRRPDANSEWLSMTMLTLNADLHPLLRRFHRPGKEKRGVVMLRPERFDEWLACRDPELARTFLGLMPADDLVALPADLLPRGPKPAGQSELF